MTDNEWLRPGDHVTVQNRFDGRKSSGRIRSVTPIGLKKFPYVVKLKTGQLGFFSREELSKAVTGG